MLTSYEICYGQCLYILCVLSFSIFSPFTFGEHFCYLVGFQMVKVECWAVAVLLFLKLFLQVSLLVHFLQYLDANLFCTFGLVSMRFSLF